MRCRARTGARIAGRSAGPVGVGLSLALVLAGCAGPDAPPVEVVTITSTGFQPASVTIAPGTELRFVNQVAGRASVTSLEPGDPTDPDADTVSAGTTFDSGPLGQGEAFALLVEEPGQHVYHSTFHTDLNWVGTISVEAP